MLPHWWGTGSPLRSDEFRARSNQRRGGCPAVSLSHSLSHVLQSDSVVFRHAAQQSGAATARPCNGGNANGSQQADRDNAHKGAVKKRTQLKNAPTGTSTERNKEGGRFMAVKKSAMKFKGVRRER